MKVKYYYCYDLLKSEIIVLNKEIPSYEELAKRGGTSAVAKTLWFYVTTFFLFQGQPLIGFLKTFSMW